MSSHRESTRALSEPIGDDVFLIDTRIGGHAATTGCYVILGERPLLVETGPSRSAATVIAALATLGIGPKDLAAIAVTHIHLDHAGGVGDLALAFPAAQVFVHPRGAKHLADPGRLMASAQRVYGDGLERMFGRLKPTPRHRITAAPDGFKFGVSRSRSIRMWHSAGHAGHHAVLFDESNGDLYTGDAAGMYVPQTQTYKPTTPPPEFDLEAFLGSLLHMRSLEPSRLLFSHYGPGPDADQGLDAAVEEVCFWLEQTRIARAACHDVGGIVAAVKAAVDARYRELTASPLNERWEELSSTYANVSGLLRWLETTE